MVANYIINSLDKIKFISFCRNLTQIVTLQNQVLLLPLDHSLINIFARLCCNLIFCGSFQEEFAQSCIVFLRRRCPSLLGVTIDKELPKSAQLPQETVVTMLSCLQAFLRSVFESTLSFVSENIWWGLYCTGNDTFFVKVTKAKWKLLEFYSQAPPELAETISQMLTNHGPLVKARPSAAVVGIPFKRQGSLDAGLPPNLSGQVEWRLWISISCTILFLIITYYLFLCVCF